MHPARAIIHCHADSCPSSPTESKNVSSDGISCVLPSYVIRAYFIRNKQIYFIFKEDARFPIVSTDALLLTCIIDVEEHRDVAVVDIPNTFIQTRLQHKKDMDITNIRGVLVDILLEIAPHIYDPYVTAYSKGVNKLVVQWQNAIYIKILWQVCYTTRSPWRALNWRDMNSILTTHVFPTRSSIISKWKYAFMSTIVN